MEEPEEVENASLERWIHVVVQDGAGEVSGLVVEHTVVAALPAGPIKKFIAEFLI